MTTRRPLQPIGIHGRSPNEAAHEAVILQSLTRFLPDLRENVRKGLTEDHASLVCGALGDPAAIAEHVAELAQEAGAPEAATLKTRLTCELRELSTGRPSSTTEILAEEVEHTNAELVRHWFSCTFRAWELLGRAQRRLRLGDTLLPDRSTYRDDPGLGVWNSYYEASKEALFCSIALDEPGRRLATDGFVTNVKSALAGGPVELPRSLALTRDAAHFAVVPAS
jgi:hypothetical protein